MYIVPFGGHHTVTQIFFSIGVTFGIMTAYGSHCKRTEPAFMNACVIAFANCIFSFIAGFAVFATLGHLAYTAGVDHIADLESSVRSFKYFIQIRNGTHSYHLI